MVARAPLLLVVVVVEVDEELEVGPIVVCGKGVVVGALAEDWRGTFFANPTLN